MLTTVTLRAGTKYQEVDSVNGVDTLGEQKVLDQAIEVEVVHLGNSVNMYEAKNGIVIVVRVENEVR